MSSEPLGEVSAAVVQRAGTTRHVVAVLATFAGLLLALLALLAATGVGAGEAARASVTLAFGSLGFGIAWGLARGHRRVDVLELLGVGTALFTAFYALARVTLAGVGWLPPTWLLVLVVVAVPALGWTLARRRGTATFEPAVTPASILAVIVGVGLFLLLNRYQIARYALPPQTAFTGYSEDMFLFESLGQALARFGASESGLMSGWPIRYHWLSYAFGGSLSVDSDLSPFVALTRVIPLLSAIALAQPRRGLVAPTRGEPMGSGRRRAAAAGRHIDKPEQQSHPQLGLPVPVAHERLVPGPAHGSRPWLSADASRGPRCSSSSS